MWTTTEQAAFGKQMTILADVMDYPMSTVRIAGYVALMDDLVCDDVIAGLQLAAKEEPFFPKPSQIRERAEDRAYGRLRRLREAQEKAVRLALQPAPEPPPINPEAIVRSDANRTTLVSWIAEMRERFNLR